VNPKTGPRHPLHAMLAFLAAHVVALQQCTAVTARRLRLPYSWHHLHHLLCAQCTQWSFPIAGAAFIASSRAKCVSSK
jgi:hypothetical protein